MKAELMNRMQEILEEAVAAKELAGGACGQGGHGKGFAGHDLRTDV